MPTIKYSNNPNSDTAFVVQDGGQKNRAVLTAEPAGTLQLSDSANVSTGYVTDEDGKKHKVNLVAQLEGDIEFSENPNSTKGYATVDGKKHRVVLTASLAGGGGSTPVIDELNVTPSTSAQTITAPSGTDGYSPVNVSAVTSAIDANIVAGNIKKDVQILGVTGSYEGQTPTGTKQITTNGIHDVAGYANADVQVPTTAPAHYVEKTVDTNGKLINSNKFIDLTGVTDIGDNILYTAYFGVAFPANTSIDMSSLTTISGSYACRNIFRNSTGIASADLSSLTKISGNYACDGMFDGYTGITSIDLSSLTTISGIYACEYMFRDSTVITSIDLSSLTTISGSYACNYMFKNSGITSIDLSSLTTISGSFACNYMFGSCVNLISIYLPQIKSPDSGTRLQSATLMFADSGLQICDMRNLESVGDYGILDNMLSSLSYINTINLNALTHIGKEAARAFLSATNSTIKNSLTDLYFPMLTTFGTNPFHSSAFSNRQGLTIHFRKDAQATVEALANYATLWGAGTGSSVVFDLAGTLTGADSNAYARAEKYSVYASETAGAAKTATAWRYNDTTYYTSGGSEPQIGDTIYSDSACTTAVTTISSIA